MTTTQNTALPTTTEAEVLIEKTLPLPRFRTVSDNYAAYQIRWATQVGFNTVIDYLRREAATANANSVYARTHRILVEARDIHNS